MAKETSSSARPGRLFEVQGNKSGVVATIDFGGHTMLQRDFLYGGLQGVRVQVKTAEQQSKLIITTTTSSKKKAVEKALLRILPASKVQQFLHCWGQDKEDQAPIKGLNLSYLFWRLRYEGYC